MALERSFQFRLALLATLAGALAVIALAPAKASAAACANDTTTWLPSAPNNNFHDDANWDKGTPSLTCDAIIAAADEPVIISGAATVKKLTLGSGQTLKLQNSVFPTLVGEKVEIQSGATLQLGCVIGTTCGTAQDPAAQVRISSTELDAISNAGLIFISGAGNDAERQIWGNVTNTGTLLVENGMRWSNNGSPATGTFTNKGTVSLTANCKIGMGDDCMYSNTSESNFVNDAGGQITNNGSSKYFLVSSGFTQGAGSTSTGAQPPVRLRGATAVFTGASSTAVIGMDFLTNVTGTVGPGQTIKDYGAQLRVPGLEVLHNQGTIEAAANGTLLDGNITTEAGGLLNLATGTTSHSAGTLDATGGSMLIAAGTTLFEGTLMNHGGQIVGGGTIVGNVNNVSGLLNPALGIGSMTITGDYTQGPGATLAIEAQGVAGPQHDLLNVGHKVTLDGTLRIVPELGFFSPAEGDALKVIDYNDPRSGEFAKSLADPAFTTANPVNVGYDDGNTAVFAFIGPPTVTPPNNPVAPLLNSPIYRTILESLQPNGSFTFTKKPIVFPSGRLGLEVDTGGSCRLTAVEKPVASPVAAASASKKAKKKPKGLIKKVTINANGSGTHIVPLTLTPKAKKLMMRKGGKGKKGKAGASAASTLKDPLVITCTPIVYPVANFPDGTQVTGIGKAPTGNPPAGQPSIPAGPPAVQPGVPVTTRKPVVPLPPQLPQPTSPPTKTYKATGDLDATVGAGVSFFSNGKVVTGFDVNFRVVCGFPFPNSAPLESVHFDEIPVLHLLGADSPVIQGSFEVASQNSSNPPTWITASVQGDNSNGYTVRVYERRAGCEGGTIFNARRVP